MDTTAEQPPRKRRLTPMELKRQQRLKRQQPTPSSTNSSATKPRVPGTRFTPSNQRDEPSFFKQVTAGVNSRCDDQQRHVRPTLADLTVVSADHVQERVERALSHEQQDTRAGGSAMLGDGGNSSDLYTSTMTNINALRVADTTMGPVDSTMIQRAPSFEVTTDASGSTGWSSIPNEHCIPMDWSLKSGFRVLSPKGREWYHTSKANCAVARNNALHRVIGPPPSMLTAPSPSMLSGTVHHVYPSTPLPEPMLKALIGKESFKPDSANYYHIQYTQGGKRTVAGKAPSGNPGPVVGSGISIQPTSGTTIARADSDASPASGFDGQAFCFQRRCEWGGAFMSLFNSLKNTNCGYFYLVDQAFVVLFLAKGTINVSPEDLVNGDSLPPSCSPPRQHMYAMLSHSNRGLRRQLTKCGLEYETPLDPELKQNDNATQIELFDELKRLEDESTQGGGVFRLKRSSSTYQDDGQNSNSLLAFTTDVDVVGLYGFLMNRVVRRGGGAFEVPQLLAPVPFEHAAVAHASMSTPVVGSKAHQTGKREQQHVVRFQGAMLPSNYTRVCQQMLGDTLWGDDWTVQFQVSEMTTGFNRAIQLLRRSDKQPGVVKRDGSLDVDTSVQELRPRGDGNGIRFKKSRFR